MLQKENQLATLKHLMTFLTQKLQASTFFVISLAIDIVKGGCLKGEGLQLAKETKRIKFHTQEIAKHFYKISYNFISNLNLCWLETEGGRAE